MTRSRQLRHDGRPARGALKRPRQFYLLTCGTVSALAIYGAVWTLAAEHWSAPSISQIVAAAAVVLATGWFALLIAQTVLVQLKQTFDHRRLGQSAALLGFAIPLAAIAGAVLRVREASALASADPARAEVMLLVHLVDGLIFLACLSAALARREAPDFHRRWMVMAMVALVPEAVMGQDPTTAGLAVLCAGAAGLVLVAVIRDLVRLGRIHRVYRVGLLPVVGGPVVALAVQVGRWPALLAVVDSLVAGRI